MADDWLDRLKRLVQKKPLVLFRFEGEEWSRLRESRRGANEFTIARSHDLFEKVRVPTACLVIGKDDDGSEVYFGLASSRSTVTTLESRIKVKRALHIQPSSKAGILKLVTDKAHARNLRDRLSSHESVIALSSKLSVHLVEKLAAIESNRGAIRAAVVLLSAPKYYRGMDAVQEDAVHTALRAFGLSPGDQVVSLELTRGRYTALVRVNIMEDSVVEYDARTFPDYELIGSDITGRAVSIRARRRRCSWSVRMARTNSSTTGCGATTTSSNANRRRLRAPSFEHFAKRRGPGPSKSSRNAIALHIKTSEPTLAIESEFRTFGNSLNESHSGSAGITPLTSPGLAQSASAPHPRWMSERRNDRHSETYPKAALVTGAGRRLGRAIAQRLAREGWSVAVHYNGSAAAAESCVREIEAAGGRAIPLRANLAEEDQVATMVTRAGTALGPLGCLVNNASAFELDTVETATRASWDRHLEPNLRAPFLLSQDMAAALPASSGGCIVNIIDQRVWNLTPFFMSYTLSKAGLWTLTRTLAMALAPRIRVNAIGPGPALPSPRQTEEQFARQESHMPLGRGTTPAEVAETVAFLTRAHAMTGQMMALDGGQHLGWAQPGEDGLRFEE